MWGVWINGVLCWQCMDLAGASARAEEADYVLHERAGVRAWAEVRGPRMRSESENE